MKKTFSALVAISLAIWLNFLWGRALLDVIEHPLKTAMVTLGIACVIVFLTLYVRYLSTLRSALASSSSESRIVSPGTVWWMLLPFFNVFLSFFFVWSVTKSLNREFTRRRSVNPPSPKAWAGWICSIVGLLTYINIEQHSPWFVGWILLFIDGGSWIIYWRAISHCTKYLQGTEDLVQATNIV